MHPNVPPHLINESAQHYYASPNPQNTTPYNHYPNQTCFYPSLDQRYAMPQGQPSHLVMPFAQPPVIIFASPTGAAYPSQFLPSGHQALYYQNMSHQQPQMVLPTFNRRLNVNPQQTSTPLPAYSEQYNMSRGSDDSKRSANRRPALDVWEEISDIPEDSIVAPPRHRNHHFNQQRGRGQNQHKPQVHFSNAGHHRQGNWNTRKTAPGNSLLKSRNFAKSMGDLTAAVSPSDHGMRSNRGGMSRAYPAKSVMDLNKYTEAHNAHHFAQVRNMPAYGEGFMDRGTRRRSVSNLNLSGLRLAPNEQLYGRRR